jgi:hypothetical protein
LKPAGKKEKAICTETKTLNTRPIFDLQALGWSSEGAEAGLMPSKANLKKLDTTQVQ